MVTLLKCARSAGRCQGMVPDAPITLFLQWATIIDRVMISIRWSGLYNNIDKTSDCFADCMSETKVPVYIQANFAGCLLGTLYIMSVSQHHAVSLLPHTQPVSRDFIPG